MCSPEHDLHESAEVEGLLNGKQLKRVIGAAYEVL